MTRKDMKWTINNDDLLFYQSKDQNWVYLINRTNWHVLCRLPNTASAWKAFYADNPVQSIN